MDHLTSEKRSLAMSKVKSKDTAPELIVRSALHSMGYRFRLHRKDMPGKPDIVLPKYKTVVFVHGCFWHRHDECKQTTTPKTNIEFWTNKFEKNKQRDTKAVAQLKKMGWNVVIIWECQTKNQQELESLLKAEIQHISIDVTPATV